MNRSEVNPPVEYIRVRFSVPKDEQYYEQTLTDIIASDVKMLSIRKSQIKSCDKTYDCKCTKVTDMIMDYILEFDKKATGYCIQLSYPYVYTKGNTNPHLTFSPHEVLWNIVIIKKPFGFLYRFDFATKKYELIWYNHKRYITQNSHLSLSKYAFQELTNRYCTSSYKWHMYTTLTRDDMYKYRQTYKKNNDISRIFPVVGIIMVGLILITKFSSKNRKT